MQNTIPTATTNLDRGPRMLGLDLLKGLLILSVIAGHVPLASVNDSFFKWLIYGFHMPLFLGVSGFLFQRESLEKRPLSLQLKRYTTRLLIPWLLAFAVFFCWQKWNKIINGTIGERIILDAFLYPYHHLWYVPAFLMMAVALALIVKLKCDHWFILVPTFVFSVAGLSSFQGSISDRDTLYWLGDKRAYLYFYFLLVGYFTQVHSLYLIPKFAAPISVAFALIYLMTFWFHYFSVTAIAFVILNTCLIVFLVPWFASLNVGSGNILTWIGANSLPIYLWHAIVTKGTQQVLMQKQTSLLYVATTVTILTLVFAPIVLGLTRIRLINRYIFGSPVTS